MDPIISAVLKKTYNNDKNSDREINYVNMNNMDNNRKYVRDSSQYTRFLKNINNNGKKQ